MKTVLLLALTCFFEASAADRWPDDKETDSLEQMTNAVILKDYSLKPGVINQEGALLTKEQIKKLGDAMNGKHAEHPAAACYHPHNAFIYYDANKKPVAFVEICFACLNERIEPKGSSEYPDLLTMASIFDEHKLPMGAYPDFARFKRHFDEAGKPNH